LQRKEKRLALCNQTQLVILSKDPPFRPYTIRRINELQQIIDFLSQLFSGAANVLFNAYWPSVFFTRNQVLGLSWQFHAFWVEDGQSRNIAGSQWESDESGQFQQTGFPGTLYQSSPQRVKSHG